MTGSPTVVTNGTLENDPGTEDSSLIAKSSTTSSTAAMTATSLPPLTSITVQKPFDANKPLPEPDTLHRAVHKIRLSALSHNYGQVEMAAKNQRCSVIVVVKADGYGHGAIATALHLADAVGASAFAVATLEEGIALRRAFQATASLASSSSSSSAGHHHHHVDGSSTPPHSFFQDPSVASQGLPPGIPLSMIRNGKKKNNNSKRPSEIRILVLGPPVGFPRCFDDYYHHGIEAMVSGPEVARSLVEWVLNTDERKRTQVQRAANEMKAQALQGYKRNESDTNSNTSRNNTTTNNNNNNNNTSRRGSNETEELSENSVEQQQLQQQQQQQRHHRPPSATLSNMSGQDLAKEVRAMLLHHQKVAVEQHQAKEDQKKKAQQAKILSHQNSEVSANDPKPANEQVVKARRRLRWHALVDSGMGRLGFRTDPVPNDQNQDSVATIKELVDMEESADSPIQFYGMCTHMADASSTSDYTNSQIAKFKCLLKRVRDAGIFVPTVSTDNSAALLTTTLKHFDSNEILGPENGNESKVTQGFVRTGGAIYGQRPAFTQLRPVSTLTANVRHVAILKQGESVGYDRNYIAPKDVRIATLAIGFADGYPRDLGNGVGKVEIRGHVYPIAGNVCMDMLMVELGFVDEKNGHGAQVMVGDTAVLWGPSDDHDDMNNDEDDDDEGHHSNTEEYVRLQDLASQLKTTQSALTCGLDKARVLRQYG